MANKPAVIISIAFLFFVLGSFNDSPAKSKYGFLESAISAFLADYEEKEAIHFANDRSLIVFEKHVGLKRHHKLVVADHGNVLLKYDGKGAIHVTLPSANALLAGRYYIFLEQEIDTATDKMSRTATVTAIDLETNLPVGDFIKLNHEEGEGYFGIDVDQSGNYVLLPYLIEDPEFPLLRVYDYAKKQFHEIDTDQLTDYSFEKMRWKRSLESIEFFNFISGKDEEVLLDWEKKRILVNDN